MLTSYAEYYRFISEYASSSDKIDELSAKKAETIVQTFANEQAQVETVLCVGFSLAAVGLINLGYTVTIINCSPACIEYGDEVGISDLMLPDDILDHRPISKYDAVVALDDYITNFDTEEVQRDVVKALIELSQTLVILTARDYKNLPQHARNFDEPLAFSYEKNKDVVMFNRRKWRRDDKQVWDNYMFVITEDGACILGPLTRRTIYFKQLASIAHECDVAEYKIQKSLMYKPLFAKHYEHIITIKP
jgi:hypothetical protein